MFKTILPLSAILSMRFLGLFLVLPLLSLYAIEMEGATKLLVGIVVGGYALTQALLQLPFGILSDRIGRKITILFGLLIFLVGSIICALSEDIYMLMFGRFLQGAGAIGSVITAMISDTVKEEVRAKAMAIMGGSIAMSFAVAMVAGPTLGANYGIDILFWITAALAILSIVILYTKVPDSPKITHAYNENSSIKEILKERTLLHLIITGMLQKGMMTAAFVTIPLIMLEKYSWPKDELWQVYLLAMVAGVIAMAPAVIVGEKKNKPKLIFLISIALFSLTFLLMWYAHNASIFIGAVVLFFIGFNMLEPLLQSMISKLAKVHQRGAALGIANTFAYFGTFIGGTFAGATLQLFGIEVLGGSLFIVSIIWLAWTAKMPNPIKYSNHYMLVKNISMQKLQSLNGDGIKEWYINETEGIAIVKYNPKLTDTQKIEKLLIQGHP